MSTQNHPFTEPEKQIMDLIVQAHNLFCTLPDHQQYSNEWAAAIHVLQSNISHRALKRLYPEYFR